MSKWDDQFDFDDYDAKPKKAKEAKKNKKDEDDFFDLDDDPVSNTSKLPAINNKNSKDITNNASSAKNNKKSKNVYDDYEEIYEQVEEVKSPPKSKTNKKKEVEESNFYEQLDQLEDIKEIKPKNESSFPKANKGASKQYEQEEFYEEIEEIKPPPRNSSRISPPKPKVKEPEPQPEPEDNYEQNFEDDYGEDFEEEAKESPKKSNTTANLKTKDKNVSSGKAEPKKYSVNSNQVFTNKKDTRTQPAIPKMPQKQNKLQTRNASKKTIEKGPAYGSSQPPKQIQRSNSRKSFKSNDSRSHIGNSRVTKKYNTEFTSNKHILQVERAFPDDDKKLNTMSIDRLTKVNENIREMIRKFNDQLNELINKNMILLKQKPNEKDRKTDDKIRVLQEQLRSGATQLQMAQNEYDRLKGREGELKEEEYLLMMEKRIEEGEENKKLLTKAIHKLQVEVNSDGNKLSRKDAEKKAAQNLHQIKTMLIQAKKQEEKQESKLSKLDIVMEQLSGKNSDKEYELTEQIDSAKEKGIKLNPNQTSLRKYEQLKAKVVAAEKNIKALEGLYKSKGDTIGHDNEQIKIACRNIESQIKNNLFTLEHSQEESIKLIKKAKENPKTGSSNIEMLDRIMKFLEDSQNNNYFDVRSEGNKSQASERPLKKSMYQNMSKEKPTRNNSSKKDPAPTKHKTEQNDDINLMKPNFMKKKFKKMEEEDETNRQYERVWSQEEESRKKLQERRKEEEEEKRKEEQRKKEEERKREQQRQREEEQSKKKPFNLKRNRKKNEEKSMEVSPKKDEEPDKFDVAPAPPVIEAKEEEKLTIGPKFTRFSGRNKKINLSLDQPEEKKEEEKKVVEQEPPKQDEPIFKPKRFNMRNKIEKKDDSYVPSIEVKKQEPKEEIIIKPKEEETFKIPPRVFRQEPKLQIKEEIPVAKSEQPQIKPRFTLKLRDRQKKQNNDDGGYMPTRMTEPQKSIQTGYNPSKRESAKEKEPFSLNLNEKKDESYAPSFKKAEKDNNINPVASNTNNQNLPKEPINNPYAQKQVVNNPYAQKQTVVNPYAPKEDAPKREKEGPVKKAKILNKAPKEKFNIYEQAQDLTEPAVSQPIAVNEPAVPKAAPAPSINLAKTDELDLAAMLGKEKKKENNDFNDLLVDVKVEKKKEKKKGGNDFFNDLLLD